MDRTCEQCQIFRVNDNKNAFMINSRISCNFWAYNEVRDNGKCDTHSAD